MRPAQSVARRDGLPQARKPDRTMFAPAQEAWLTQGSPSSAAVAADRPATQSRPDGVETPGGPDASTARLGRLYPRAANRLGVRSPSPRRAQRVLPGRRRAPALRRRNLRLRPNDTQSPIVSSEFVCSCVTSPRPVVSRGWQLVRCRQFRTSFTDALLRTSAVRLSSEITYSRSRPLRLPRHPFPAPAGASCIFRSPRQGRRLAIRACNRQ